MKMIHGNHALEAGAHKAYTDRISNLEIQTRRLVGGRGDLDVDKEGLVMPNGEVREVKELKEGLVSIIFFSTPYAHQG